MTDSALRFINEEFYAESVSPGQIDRLLARGWRHFGEHFFRYNLGFYEGEIRRVIPLRIRLADFYLSKSQRRVLKRNSDLAVVIAPALITPETEALFDRHKRRFRSGTPESIYEFLSSRPDAVPIPAYQVEVRENETLIAASFFDVGEDSLSSIYGIFDPAISDRSLGILTMLKEIEHALSAGKRFYYHGYAYEGNSFYDYKKRFSGLEAFNWRGSWAAYKAPVRPE